MYAIPPANRKQCVVTITLYLNQNTGYLITYDVYYSMYKYQDYENLKWPSYNCLSRPYPSLTCSFFFFWKQAVYCVFFFQLCKISQVLHIKCNVFITLFPRFPRTTITQITEVLKENGKNIVFNEFKSKLGKIIACVC